MNKIIRVLCVLTFLVLSPMILINANMVDQQSYNNHNMMPGITYYSPEIQQGSNTYARGWFDNNGDVDGYGDMTLYHKVTGGDTIVCSPSAGDMPSGTGHKECSASSSGISGDTNYTSAKYSSTSNGGYITSQVGVE